MRMIVTRADLVDALQAAKGFTKRASPQQMLANVKLSTDAAGGGMTVEATNAESSVRLRLAKVQVERPGAVATLCEELLAVVASMHDETVALDAFGGASGLEVAGSSAKFNLPAAGAEAFPLWPAEDPGAGVEVAGAVLKRLIRQTAGAADDRSATFPAMAGVLVEAKGGRLTLVGTDGNGLAISAADVTGKAAMSLIVPPELLTRMARTLADDDAVTVAPAGSGAVFSTPSAVVRSSTIEGVYPPYGDVRPKDAGAVVVAAGTEELSRILAQVCLVAVDESGQTGTGAVVVEAKPASGMTFAARSFRGTAAVAMPCKVDGGEIRIGLAARYLRDGVRNAEADEVTIEFYAPNRPLKLTAGDYQYVLSPRSIQ